MADDGGEVASAISSATPYEYSDELAAEICARVAAGESLMALGRDPSMPHRTTIRRWANRREAFAARLWAALREARLARRARDRAALAARAAAGKPARPGKRSLYTPELAETICERIANGQSVIAIAADPDMPCAGTIYGWARRLPDFADMYVRAREVQGDYLFDEAREVALAATPASVWVSRLQFDTIRWMTARLAPKKYCERVMVEAEIAARRAEDDPERQGLTVIIKRANEITDEELENARLTEEGYFDRPRGRR